MVSTSLTFADKVTLKPLHLSALVLYEDVIIGELGRHVAQEYAARMGGQKCKVATWDAGLLHDRAFSSVIADQAANAAIVVLAVRNAQGLTSLLKSWLNRWTVQEWRKDRTVLVAVQGPSAKGVIRIPGDVEPGGQGARPNSGQRRPEEVPAEEMATAPDWLCLNFS